MWNIREQIEMGLSTEVCYCHGNDKNEKFLGTLNEKYGFFEKIVALEHPRFIMQYRSASRDKFAEKYITLPGR